MSSKNSSAGSGTMQIRVLLAGLVVFTSTITTIPQSSVKPSSASGRVLSVGPGKKFARPSQAAAAAKDGDVIEISPQTYAGDVAVWTASNLTIRGVGNRPHLKANGASAQGKGIWVIQGNNTTVENLEFS